jgi:hypothetical protein
VLARRRLRVPRDGGRGGGGGAKVGWAGIGGRRGVEGLRSSLVAVHGTEVAGGRRNERGGGTARGWDGSSGWPSHAMFSGYSSGPRADPSTPNMGRIGAKFGAALF